MKARSYLIALLCYLSLFCWNNVVEAFSHIGGFGIKRCSDNNNMLTRRNGSSNKTNQEVKGYVPDGLTPEQYAKIKQQESDRQKKMNYGAWGPRFARSGRPDGDWMVVPSLWTSGFDTNAQYSYGNKSMMMETTTKGVLRLPRGFKKYFPLYMYCFAFIETISTALHIINSKLIISLLSIFHQQIRTSASVALSKTNLIAVMKISAVKMLIAGVLIRPCAWIIERCNRRLLWSPRRTMTYGSSVPLIALLISVLIKYMILL